MDWLSTQVHFLSSIEFSSWILEIVNEDIIACMTNNWQVKVIPWFLRMKYLISFSMELKGYFTEPAVFWNLKLNFLKVTHYTCYRNYCIFYAFTR